MAHQNMWKTHQKKKLSSFDIKNFFELKTGWMAHQNAIKLSKKSTFYVSPNLQIWWGFRIRGQKSMAMIWL